MKMAPLTTVRVPLSGARQRPKNSAGRFFAFVSVMTDDTWGLDSPE